MLSQTSDGGSVVVIVVYVAPAVFYLASFWKIFTKAGQPGWAGLIPIYNYIVLMRIIGRPWWWILLFLVPIVNIVVLFIVYIDLAKSFGRSTGFGVGLALLGIPTDLMTPIFALARMAGCTAHVREQYADNRVIRPSSEYIGPRDQTWVPIEDRA